MKDKSHLFLRDLVHEMNDPLNAIQSGLEAWPGLPPAAREMLHESVLRNATILASTLQQASEYLGLGEPTPTSEPVDLRECVKQGLASIQSHLTQRDQPTSLQLPPEPVWSKTLVKATELAAGCMVSSLSRACLREVPLTVTLAQQEQTITLQVSASADVCLKEGYRVAILRTIAAVHEGELILEEGAGTRLTLTLPQQPLSHHAPLLVPTARTSVRSRRVLVVDDNKDGADTLAMWLEAHGNKVEVAYDGSHALQVFQQFQPSVVLLDIGLPGRNGYQVAEELRSMGYLGLLVATTGYGQERDRDSAFQAGFDRHLVKPVELKKLRLLLEEYFQGGGESRRRILVVEDNPVALLATKSMLQALAQEVWTAETGEQALEQLERQVFDLVLCDLGLPGDLSGYDLAALWRKQKGPTLRMIAVTGDATLARDQALKSGFDKVLEKPLKRQTLQELLNLPPA